MLSVKILKKPEGAAAGFHSSGEKQSGKISVYLAEIHIILYLILPKKIIFFYLSVS